MWLEVWNRSQNAARSVEVSDEEDGSYVPTVTFWTSPAVVAESPRTRWVLPPKMSRSTTAAQSRGSVKVVVHPPNNS